MPQLTNESKNFGLKGKLLVSMMIAGIFPLLVGMVLSYVQGNESLRGVIGSSFQTLAKETASKVDSILAKEIANNRQTSQHPDIQQWLEKQNLSPANENLSRLEADFAKASNESKGKTIQSIIDNVGTQALLSFLNEPGYSSEATRALYVTDVQGALIATINDYPSLVSHDEEVIKKVIRDGSYLGDMYLDEKLNDHVFRIILPIFKDHGAGKTDQIPQANPTSPVSGDNIAPVKQERPIIGFLHRVYSAKTYFSPFLESIRFGDSGHVMVVDGKGVVVDCPILPTGFQIENQEVVKSIVLPEAGWVRTFDNGHGSKEESIMGYSPLSLVNELLQKSTATHWHMFVWQASEELFAPTRKLLFWNSLAAIFGAVLIVLIGTYAANKIIRPVRKLRDALVAFSGGSGDSQKNTDEIKEIVVDTKDEISELAAAFNKMSQDLKATRESELKSIDEMEQLLMAMAESETRIHTVMDNVVDGLITIDECGIIESFNPAAEKIFGYKKDDVIGKNISLLMPEPDKSKHDGYLSNYLKTKEAKVIGFGREVIAQRKDGSTFHVDLAVSEMIIGDRLYFVGIMRDITQRISMEADLRKLSSAVEQSPSSVMITDALGNIEYVNPNFVETSGYTYQDVIGKKPSILKSGVHPPKFYKILWDTITEGKEWRKEFCNRKKNGELYWELQSISPLRDSNGQITHFLSVKIDDTERKRAEEKLKLYATKLERSNTIKDDLIEELQDLKGKLEISARTDPLTGLCNRRGMLEKVEYERLRFERSKKAFSFIISDIDHFKKINDTYGHDGGDFVLGKVSKCFRESLRSQDIACRWGGEEFLILLPETELQGAIILAEKIRSLIESMTFEHNAHVIRLTMSFGLSVYDEASSDMDGCVKRADECLYIAKASGRNRVISTLNKEEDSQKDKTSA